MSAESYKEKGNEYFKKGDYEKAIENYTYACEIDPKNHLYYTNRSLCYASMKRWDKSLRDADKSIALNPNWVKGYYRRGVALRESGDYQKALEAFERCIDIDPKNPEYKKAYESTKADMYKGLSPAEIEKVEGNALFKRGKIQEAINRYSKGLDMLRGDPKEEKDKQTKADLYANRAACYVQLYEPTKVRDDCNAALTLVPNHFKALLRRGQANEALEKYKAAAEDFQAALRMHPEDKLAVQSLSRVQKAQKQMAG